MDVIKKAVEHLNPGQISVIAMDQPLFTIGKQIQWNWSDRYGEDKVLIMFGGLHIEMAFLKLIGDWLEDSGWLASLVEAKVASLGRAKALIKAKSVTRARRAHQVTASSHYILLKRAYIQYTATLVQEETAMSFDDWCKQMAESVPQFRFWWITLQLELLLLAFVRSIREVNFQLYIDALTKMVPWFFALDHPNYARWLPVHLRDVCTKGESCQCFNTV